MKRLCYFALITVFVFFVPPLSYAQIVSPGNPNQGLTINTDPVFPEPNKEVQVDVSGFSGDLKSSVITWTVNGKTVAQGIGKTGFTYTTGDMGTSATIAVTIIPPQGPAASKSVVISPSTIHFLWEADTYTPPFYKGKALFVGQSGITITAIPELSLGQGTLNPDSLVYEWTLNSFVLDNQSGYGKRSIHINGNFWGRDEEISVIVTNRENSVSTKKTLTLHPSKPMVLVYENNPLLGVLLNQAIINEFTLSKNSNEITFFASPYFFHSDLLSSGKTSYSWSMNGSPISDGNGNSVTFRNDTHGEGTSRINLDINQPDMDYGNASIGFSINFK